MKFICKQSVLNEAVNNVSRAVPVKSPVTALEGIKMYLNKNELELTGYDLELGIRTVIEVQSEDHGEFTVNAKLFSEIVRKMPSENVVVEIDEKLKVEFEDFMERGISPSKYGPKILNSALISKFMLTSKNKAQRSIECDFDFSGDSYEVTQFDNDSSVLKENIDSAEKLLCSIGNAHKSTVIGSAYVWENVDVEVIKDVFFSHYTISEHSTLNRDIPIFLEWIKKMNTEEGRYLKWNVAVAGAEKATSKWDVSGISVGKIERSVKKSKLPCLDIGSLRSGSDVLCDVDYPNLTQEQKKLCDDALKHKKNLISKRSDLGLKDIPLLLLYCIDKDGGQYSAAGIKTKINSKEDVIGFSIIIPGESDGSTHAKSVTVQLPE